MKRQYQFAFRRDGTCGLKISDVIIGNRHSIVDGEVIVNRVSDCIDHGLDEATAIFHSISRGRDAINQSNNNPVLSAD